MGENSTNKNNVPIARDLCYQSVIVSADIKHIALANPISVTVGHANIGETLPFRLFDYFVPRPERLLCVGVLCPELFEALLRDGPHPSLLAAYWTNTRAPCFYQVSFRPAISKSCANADSGSFQPLAMMYPSTIRPPWR
jgi:hypothetical protein